MIAWPSWASWHHDGVASHATPLHHPLIASQIPRTLGRSQDPALAKYYAADMYATYPFNNALFTHFLGPNYNGDYSSTLTEEINP